MFFSSKSFSFIKILILFFRLISSRTEVKSSVIINTIQTDQEVLGNVLMMVKIKRNGGTSAINKIEVEVQEIHKEATGEMKLEVQMIHPRIAVIEIDRTHAAHPTHTETKREVEFHEVHQLRTEMKEDRQTSTANPEIPHRTTVIETTHQEVLQMAHAIHHQTKAHEIANQLLHKEHIIADYHRHYVMEREADLQGIINFI